VPVGVDFTPPLTLGAIARMTIGAMLAMAADRALPLVMVRRVRMRGWIGPMSGALLRSLYPLLLGLGG
jgi:hypothetical protein